MKAKPIHYYHTNTRVRCGHRIVPSRTQQTNNPRHVTCRTCHKALVSEGYAWRMQDLPKVEAKR